MVVDCAEADTHRIPGRLGQPGPLLQGGEVSPCVDYGLLHPGHRRQKKKAPRGADSDRLHLRCSKLN